MTRQEQIEQAANEYCQTNIPNLSQMHLAISTAFEAGAKWADEHTAKFWHRVADGDLPSEPQGDEFDMPFIVSTNGEDVLFAYYAHKEEEESPEFYDDCELPLDVMYWAEIPKLPENKKK